MSPVYTPALLLPAVTPVVVGAAVIVHSLPEYVVERFGLVPVAFEVPSVAVQVTAMDFALMVHEALVVPVIL